MVKIIASIICLWGLFASQLLGQSSQIGIPDSVANIAFPGSTGAYTIQNPLNHNGTQFTNAPITVNCIMNCRADILYFHDLDLNIPPTATITGIELIHGRGGCNSGSYVIDTINLAHNGGAIGTLKRDSTSNIITDTLGGAMDTWGAALTPAMVNDNSFGVFIRSNGTGICTFGQWDVRLVVYYCDSPQQVQGIPDSVANVAFAGSTGAYTISNPLAHNGTQFTNPPMSVNCVINCVSDYLYFQDFDLNIPSGASITGIELFHHHSGCNQNAWVIDTLQLAHNGVLLGATKRDSASNSPSTTLGGSSDLWGAALTASILNDPTFGVMVRSTGTGICTHAQHDLRITVYFACSGGATAISAPISSPSLILAPNPAQDRIEIISEFPVTKIQCFNIIGKAFSLPQNGNTLDITTLNSGTYIIQVTGSNGQITTGRFVKLQH